MASLTIGLFLAMLFCFELGIRLGRRNGVAVAAATGIGAIEAAIFGLLGLLLGFGFAGAMSRFDDRRHLVIQEANAIATAYARIDLLPARQDTVRRLFREYLDARLRVYENISDQARAPRIVEAARLQRRIWDEAVAAGRSGSMETTAQVVLPAINEMTTVTTARTLALRTRTPTLILALLILVSLLSAVMAGHSVSDRPRSLLHMMGYATCVALTVYTVLDLDNPRKGLIRLASADVLLQELRNSIRE